MTAKRASRTRPPKTQPKAIEAPRPVAPEPWPPPAPVIDGVTCVELTTLPLVGTLVVKMRASGPQIGTVQPYEEFHPTQYMFPVRWGASTSMESVCPRTWMLPEPSQPDGRRPPRRTGMCARLDLEAGHAPPAGVPKLPGRTGAMVVEGTVVRSVSA